MATLRQDSRNGLFTRCSQLPGKIGSGRCTHIEGGDVATIELDKSANIVIIDASNVTIKMSLEEAQAIMKEIRRPKDKDLPGIIDVKDVPEPKAGKISRKLVS